MDRKTEFQIKRDRIGKYLEKAGADGVVLGRTDHFAWAACGASSYVNTATDNGAASLLYLDGKAVVITNRIEKQRLIDEEISSLPVDVDAIPWQQDQAGYALKKYIGDKKVLSDNGFGGLPLLDADFSKLMMDLTEAEVRRYRALGGRAGKALQTACKDIRQNMTEREIAGMVSHRCYDVGITPIVVLVAADDRIAKYRHPLPTGKTANKMVMVVLCGRRNGLIASCTRMVSFGTPTQEIMDRYAACVMVDVNFNVNTLPGTRVGDVFELAQRAYKMAGFDLEWDLHHQGGPTGYRTRYYTATQNSDDMVAANSAYAWNPSITGAKSEDTLLVLEDHNELISQAPDWPQIELECEHMSIERPDILVV
jgi:Xaa-Pro aminopeptidase